MSPNRENWIKVRDQAATHVLHLADAIGSDGEVSPERERVVKFFSLIHAIAVQELAAIGRLPCGGCNAKKISEAIKEIRDWRQYRHNVEGVMDRVEAIVVSMLPKGGAA